MRQEERTAKAFKIADQLNGLDVWEALDILDYAKRHITGATVVNTRCSRWRRYIIEDHPLLLELGLLAPPNTISEEPNGHSR